MIDPISILDNISKKPQSKISALELATRHYEHILSNDIRARNYLFARGITAQTMDEFRIGSSNEAEKPIVNIIDKKFITEKDLIECGLIINKADSGSMPLFHNRRIIFPVMLNNNVKTITSRAISNKVLIHHLHTKSQINIFYNHDILDKTEEAYITEGPFDCLSMVQMGYPSVGLFGCQYSPKRFGNWFKNLKKIYIIFDNDLNSSGQKAALKLARELVTEEQSSFIDVYLVELPDGMDCNDLYKLGTHGRTRLRECVKCPIIFKNTEYGKNVMKQKKTQTQQKEYVRTDNSITVLDLAIKYARPKSDLDLHPSEGSKAFFYCPFPQHNDNNPSLVIYPNNTFYCFGCGKYGNAISFLAFYKNITFAKAKKLLEEQEKEITK